MIGTCPGAAADAFQSALLLTVGVAPAVAAERSSISFVAATTFGDDIPDGFTTTGLAGCGSGIVENGPVNFAFNPALNTFAGFKVFFCANEDNGFVLRLNARFGEGGSVGTWSVVDAWGSLAGMTGAGTLVGDPISTGGILDQYTGTLTFR
jgi:hypothetical protein